MKLLILNASPKRKGGASRFFSKLLRLMLWGCTVTVCDLRGPGDYERALSLLSGMDAVVMSVPLYVDAVPSHVLPFLMKAEQLCRKGKYHFKLYVLSNSGFVEGCQNAIHLKMYEAWCRRAGIEWGGGLGIGGGVMLHVLYLLLPISVAIRMINIVRTIWQSGYITGSELWSCCSGLLWNLFFIAGVVVCEAAFACAIRRKKKIRNMYTRPLLPSFLFLIGANIFALVSSVLERTWPHQLFKRIDVSKDRKTDQKAV